MHDRARLPGVFGAEDVAQLMDERHNIQFRVRVGSAVAKFVGYGAHDIVTQPLVAIPDPVHPRFASGVNIDPLGGKGDDQVVGLALILYGKILLKPHEQSRRRSDSFLLGPRSGTLRDEADSKLSFKGIRGRLHQASDFLNPRRVSLPQTGIGENLDPHDPGRGFGSR